MGSLQPSRLVIVLTVVFVSLGACIYIYRYHHDDGTKPRPLVRLKVELVIVPYLKYNTSDSAIQEREKEYMTVLKKNLDHTIVGKIHLLTTDTEKTTQWLEAFGLSNHNKLLIVKVNIIV